MDNIDLLTKLADSVDEGRETGGKNTDENQESPKEVEDKKANGDKKEKEKGEKKEKKGMPFQKKEGEPEEEAQQPTAGGGTDLSAVIDFLAQNPAPDDNMVHQFIESQGHDVPTTEAVFYALAGKYVMLLRGGKSQGLDPSSVDPEQLAAGIEVEAEHTDDPATRKKIALDHLAEDPEYYSKLQQMESADQAAVAPVEGGDQQQAY